MIQFPNEVSEFTYVRSYSRWIPELGRRETWDETVERTINFILSERGSKIPPKTILKIRQYMLAFEVMPAMRLVWAAGAAARRDNTTIYNCSFAKIDCVDAFAENLYILMCGSGFAFSVTQEAVSNLPTVPTFKLPFTQTITHTVTDSREGWADSVKILMRSLYLGQDVHFDYSKLRPEGARLLTMGGRASGPAPLINLHTFIRDTMIAAQGRKLKTIECHDICTQIAEAVIVGGVRRSSEMSISDLNDLDMRNAKNMPFPARRFMANNSAIYTRKPIAVEFLKEWSALAESGTGERGIFNQVAAREHSPTRRNATLIEGTNPCGEVMLRNQQFCNLSEVVVRPTDDLDSLLDKVETATWLGAIQSTFTHFPYLRPQWKKNCDEERLMGVSLTGVCDSPEIINPTLLIGLRNRARKIARHAAKALGINYAAAITLMKPSGTVSQLVNSSSGIHPRFASNYIRRFRISRMDPLYEMMKAQGIPFEPENESDPKNPATLVCGFVVKSPKGSITRDQMDAIQQLEVYRVFQEHWCEHNASCTIYVKDHEWFSVGNWVYHNWEIVNGLSFFPYDNSEYKLAPYEEVDDATADKLLAAQKKIDYSQLSRFELQDQTEGAKTLACAGEKCDLK